MSHPSSPSAHDPIRRSTPLWLWIWFALVAGLAEATLLLIRQQGLGRTIHLGQDAIWLAPVANLAWLAAPALLLWLILRLKPAARTMKVVTVPLAFIAWSAITLFNARLHWAGALLLALGLAVVTGRIFARWPASVVRIVHLSTPLLMVVVAALAAWVQGGRILRERRALAALPPAPSAAPNVLLLIIDTARWLDFSLAGYDRPTTPNLERWAARGVTFNRAFTSAPWTLPSHATIFTGHLPLEMSADWKVPLDGAYPTLAEALRDRGYATGGFCGNNTYCSYEHGLTRGFSYYRDYTLSPGQIAISSSLGRKLSESSWLRRLTGYYNVWGRKSAAVVNQEFLHWEAQTRDRPFFAFLNYFDVHEPYIPPAGYDRFGDGRPRNLDQLYHVTGMAALPFKETRPPEEMARERAAYQGALTYVDEQIGELLDSLDRGGVLRNTIVVITADHGEHFGEHGLFEHGNSLYRGVMQVPLLLIWPEHIPVGRRLEPRVSLRDIPATVTELTGATSRFPGKSLSSRWRGDSTVPEPVFMDFRTEEGRPVRGVIAGGWQYIRTKDGTEELYHVDSDPDELTNLAAMPEHVALLGRLRQLVDSQIVAAQRR